MTRDLLLASLDLHFVCNLPVQTDIQDIYHRDTKHDTVQADMFGVYIYLNIFIKSVLPQYAPVTSAGIEMQFQYRYQTLFWLCISIDIEISFHAVKSVILHLLIFQLS